MNTNTTNQAISLILERLELIGGPSGITTSDAFELATSCWKYLSLPLRRGAGGMDAAPIIVVFGSRTPLIAAALALTANGQTADVYSIIPAFNDVGEWLTQLARAQQNGVSLKNVTHVPLTYGDTAHKPLPKIVKYLAQTARVVAVIIDGPEYSSCYGTIANFAVLQYCFQANTLVMVTNFDADHSGVSEAVEDYLCRALETVPMLVKAQPDDKIPVQPETHTPNFYAGWFRAK